MSRAASAVLAFGGNALIRPDQTGTHREQLRSARRAARAVVTLVREGFKVVVVHGNGPQVGRELIRNEEASTKIPPAPMDLCVAATQGTIGFLLATEIQNELRRNGVNKSVTNVATQVLINPNDDAFRTPTKPVGPFYSAWRAKVLMKGPDIHMIEDAGRGWRRVVPSPRPLEILNIEAIETLLDASHVVIAGGGGGIPVAIDAKGDLIGVEAVIDKDRTAALLAQLLGAEMLALLTAVDQVYVNFGRTDQRALERVDAVTLRGYIDAGQFPPGSMGPKVEAALEFVEEGGTTALITSAEKFAAALADRAGTRVCRHVDNAPMRRQMPLFFELDTNADDSEAE